MLEAMIYVFIGVVITVIYYYRPKKQPNGLDATVKEVVRLTGADNCTIITVKYLDGFDSYGVVCDESNDPALNVATAYYALFPDAYNLPCNKAYFASILPTETAANVFEMNELRAMIFEVQVSMEGSQQETITDAILEIIHHKEQTK